MDGSSMPGAGNIAIDAKTIAENTKKASEEIAKCFNSAIKYVCDSIKSNSFDKEFNKNIDKFCSNTKTLITKLFTNMGKIMQEVAPEQAKVTAAFTNIVSLASLPNIIAKQEKEFGIFNIRMEILYRRGVRHLKQTINFLIESINSIKVDSTIKDSIERIKKTTDAIFIMIKSTAECAKSLRQFILAYPLSRLGIKLMNSFILALNGTVDLIEMLGKNINRKTFRAIRELKHVIRDLLLAGILVALFIPIAPFAALGLMAMTLFVAGLVLMGVLLNMLSFVLRGVYKSVKKLLAIVTMLLLVGVTVCLFLLITPFIPIAMMAIMLFLTGLLVVSVMLILISAIASHIKWEGLLMLVISFALLLAIAFCIMLISKVIENVIWENLLLFSAILVAFVIGIIALAAFIVPLGFAFGTIALIAGSAGLLLLTAMALVELSKYGDEIELESVKSFIDSVTELAGKLSLFGFKSAFMIPFIGAALGAVLTICGAMGPMLLLSKELSLFDTSIDYKERMSGVLGIIDAVYEKSSEWNPIKMRILSYNMWQLRSVAKTLSKMADTVAKIARLNVPTKWDKDGNPTEFRAMKDTDFDNMHDNIGKIIGSFIDWTEDKDILDLMVRASIAEDIFDDLEDIIKPIGQMAKVVQNVASMQIPNKWDNQGNVIGYELLNNNHITAVGENIKKIIGCFTDWVDDGVVEDLEDKADDMEDIFDDLEEIISPIADMVDVVVKMASMQIADKWDDKGKAIHFTTLDDEMINAATENVKNITKGFITSICGFGEDFWEYVEDAADAAEDAFDELEEIVDPIKTIVDMTVNIAKQQIPTEWDSEGKPIKYTTLDNALMGQATENINTITTDFIKMLVGPGNPFVGKKPKDFENIADIMDYIEDAIDPIVSIVELVKDMASMRIPDKWDKTGKPISYTKLSDDDFTSANTNINTIITGFISTLSSVSFTKEQQIQAEFAAKQISKITGAIEPIKGMVEIIQQVASGKFPIAFNSKGEAIKWMQLSKMFNPDGTPAEEGQKFSGTIKGLITLPPKAIAEGLSNVGADISIIKGAQSNLKIMSSASATLGDMVKYLAGLDDSQVKRTKEVTENNIKWLDKISAINIDKVKTTAAMFHEMAEFSKSISGDFDKLADTLNEKLMKILEELRDVLKDTGESVDKLAEKKASGSSSATNSSKESPVAEAPAKADEDKNKKVDLTQTNTKIDRVVTEIGALTAELARWRSNM